MLYYYNIYLQLNYWEVAITMSFMNKLCSNLSKNFQNRLGYRNCYNNSPEEVAIAKTMQRKYQSSSKDYPKKNYASNDFIYSDEAQMAVNLLNITELNTLPFSHKLNRNKFKQFLNKYYPGNFVQIKASATDMPDGEAIPYWSYTEIKLFPDNNNYRIYFVDWGCFNHSWDSKGIDWPKDFCIQQEAKFAKLHKGQDPSYSFSQCLSTCVYLVRKSSQNNARNKVSIQEFPKVVNQVLQALIPTI